MEGGTPSHRPASGASEQERLFDERRLAVLVNFSSVLRPQIVSSVLIVAGVIWAGGAPASGVLAWLLAALVVREVRAAALLRLAANHACPIDARLNRTAWWTLLLGLMHGAPALFMPHLDTAFDAVLTMILLSLSAGAVSTSFTVPIAFLAYAAGITVPTALMWFSSGGWMGWGVGALVLMLLGVQRRFSNQNLILFEESYRMRLENAALLQQLSEERRQLVDARDAAVQADLSKSRFLAAASHDLRQPLQSLSLNSGALSRMPLVDESRSIALEISSGIEALRQMLDTLLDISKLDAGAVSPTIRPLPLGRLLEAVCARFRRAAETKGLYLRLDCPAGITVASDIEMLQRLVSNLIHNAIKFTEKGGVLLTVQHEGSRMCLTIADTGIGISPSDQERVFDDLIQVANPERNQALGRGLGLGIVRRLAHLLGITYRVESSVGEGTRFVLDLPAGDQPAPIWSDARSPHPTLTARRVLVLDDEPGVRNAYRVALSSLGCQVVCTASMEEALATLPVHRPEVALVDYWLSDRIDGLQAIARLRTVQPRLPAIVVSADTSSGLREGAARAGVPVLRKPVTDATLTAAINAVLHDPPAPPA